MPARTSLRIFLPVSLLLGTAMPAFGGDTLPGPVMAEVLRVIDGDTFVATAHIWPGQTVTVSVRLRGVDAPEMKGACEEEKTAGQKTRAALEEMIGGTTVKIRNVSGDKYFGRVVADVMTTRGEPVAENLLARALVWPYDGGRRTAYCGS